MRVIDGDFKGKSGRVVKDVFRGAVVQVGGETYSLKKDVKRCKELSRSEERTFFQFVILLLLALTVVGIPIAILLFILWKRISFTAGIETNCGKKFIFQSNDRAEFKTVRQFFGMGAASDF